MAFEKSWRSRSLALGVGLAASALVLAGCGGGGNAGSTSSAGAAGGAITIGTTDKVTKLDPAGSYDNGSFAVMNQVFPFLMNTPYGSPDVKPDIAESASFTSPTEYTVKLKPGLKFANGHDLTSSDVKFTFDRQLKINDPNGPASLLGNLASTVGAGPDDGRLPPQGRQRPDLPAGAVARRRVRSSTSRCSPRRR